MSEMTLDKLMKARERIELLESYIQTLRGALADIAFSDDMTLELARNKAKRIYESTAES